jgi:succinate-semialdehyde dehydrogenase/glutarate-semialdehyde dehydrogenase
MLEPNHAWLLKEQAYLNGSWVSPADLPPIPVFNPATLEQIGTVPSLTEQHIHTSIDAAHEAFQRWRQVSAKERAGILKAWYRCICEHEEPLAQLLTLEQGKVLAEARAEIRYAASFIEWFAEEARRVHGMILPPMQSDQCMEVFYEPVGVAAAITPWNFPAAMITRKAGPALAAGCSMIVKPAMETPFTALALAALGEKAGIPAGVLQVVTGDASLIGGVFTESKLVRKLSFTGSTRIGALLMAQSAPSLKRLSLELGGNAPFLIFADADQPKALAGLLAAKGRNNGQSCVGVNRIFVEESIRPALEQALLAHLTPLRLGNGLDATTDIGPLINQQAVEKMQQLVRDACEKGATLLCGGEPMVGKGHFFPPTLLTHVLPTMRIAQEEIFGPIYAIQSFRTEEEAIAHVNATDYGLAAYAYTQDGARCKRLAAQIEAGMVAINDCSVSYDQTPFGGIKHSGFGREGSTLGIYEYLQSKLVVSKL